MNGVALRGEVQEWVSEVAKADILVGIPSYNNARTIGHVVRAVQAGLIKYFPSSRAVLVNSDGGSTDGTGGVVQRTAIDDYDALLLHHRVRAPAKLTTPYHGLPGKGSAFRSFFELARLLDVKACAVVDADLRSITPEWVELLIKPVLKGSFDYVAPLYKRHKYDGTITNSIVYPLTRALYGRRVRQPIGGDFGFSGEMARHFLAKDVWESDVARFGIDIWMTTTAIASGFRVCQAFLGAKIHDPKDPGSDLAAMLSQVVGSAFTLMEDYSAEWKMVRGSSPVPTYGFHYAVGLEPVKVDAGRMLQAFRLGLRELRDLWQPILTAGTIEELILAGEQADETFHLGDELWAGIVYAFASAAHRRVMHRDHLLKSLTPLYLGRTASFVMETAHSDADEVESRLEELCRIFEEKKPLLLSAWD